MFRPESIKELIPQIKQYSTRLATQDTRWQNSYTDIGQEKKGRQDFGVACVVDSRCKENILSFPTISERLCALSIKTKFII